jgi:hypothetical protein
MRRRGIGRVGRPSLVGTMARTAVVAGTASAVVGHSQQKAATQANTAAQAEAYEQMQQQAQIDAAVQQAVAAQAPAAPAPAPIADAGGPSMLDQLKELAALKDAGILDEAEFAAAKAKLLG